MSRSANLEIVPVACSIWGKDRFVTTCWGETDYGISTEIRTSINVHGMGCVLLGYGIWGVGVLF
jgi:hypothetical protein